MNKYIKNIHLLHGYEVIQILTRLLLQQLNETVLEMHLMYSEYR